MSRNRMVRLSALTVSAFCLWPTMRGPVRASEQEAVRIRVLDYPRPVSAAVLQIEKHFGWVVTYEDTRYLHPSDIVDITEQVRRDGNMSKRVFGMRNGTIDVVSTPRPGTDETQVGDVLREVLALSNAAGNTGEFRADWVPGGYHVVPVAMKGKSGVVESYASPLDTRITLSYREESGLEMISRLLNAITTRSGVKVVWGTMPLSGLERARVAVDAQNDRARDVLWRALQSISPRLSWQLLCGVGDNGTCSLNIHAVPRKADKGQ